jgi:hypothetical protein
LAFSKIASIMPCKGRIERNLTAEYGKIGGNLNQIARCLNEYGAPYNALSQEVRAATAELAALKFEVLQKVGEAVGNVQTYPL